MKTDRAIAFPVYKGKRRIIFLLVLVMLTAATGTAFGKMDVQRVVDTLSRKVASGASGQTLWNLGYIFYYQYGPTKETARILSEAYQQVRSQEKMQEDALRRAARHWTMNYQYWGRVKPGDLNDQPEDDYLWRFTGRWESNLKLYPAGDQRYRPKASFYRRRDKAGWETTQKMFRPRKYR